MGHIVWTAWRYPLLKGVCLASEFGYDVWWRGVVIGPLALGVIWKSKRLRDATEEGKPAE